MLTFRGLFTWNSVTEVWSPLAKLKSRAFNDIASQQAWALSERSDFFGRNEKVFGRIYAVSLREDERFCLRTLFLHNSRAKSFVNLR